MGAAPDARPDAAAPDASRWATYTIGAGQHDATLANRAPGDPIDGFSSATGRTYTMSLDASAIYDLGDDDQWDWNKLPGLSDCGTPDLSQDGLMFGWRWRTDTSVLEVTAYANNAGTHLETDPLFTLTADELATPIAYRLWREPTAYHFTVRGAEVTLPRRCTDAPVDNLAWAAGFYFGGTSTAPHAVTAQIQE